MEKKSTTVVAHRCEICGYGWNAPVTVCPNDNCPNFNVGWRLTEDLGCTCNSQPHAEGCNFRSFKTPLTN